MITEYDELAAPIRWVVRRVYIALAETEEPMPRDDVRNGKEESP